METIICLSAKNITVLQGAYSAKSFRGPSRLVVNQYLTVPTPEATVMNGKIMDDGNELLEQLKSLKRKMHFKNATVVIESDYVKTTVSLLASSRRDVMLNMIKSVLLSERDVFGDEYVYDYCVLDLGFTANKQELVLGCALQKEIIEEYKKLFAGAKINLKRVDVTLSGILKLTGLFTDYHPTKSVICVVDDLFINLMSFKKDGSLFYLRKRFESVILTSDYYTEVVNEIIDYVHYKNEMGLSPTSDIKNDLYIVDTNLGDSRYYTRAIDEARLNENVEYMFIGLSTALKSDCVINGKTGKPFSPDEMHDLDSHCYNMGALM